MVRVNPFSKLGEIGASPNGVFYSATMWSKLLVAPVRLGTFSDN